MTVSLKLYADLARFAPPDAAAYPVAPGQTVAGIMAALGLPQDRPVSIVLNGRAARPGDPVTDGDRLAFVPPVSGG